MMQRRDEGIRAVHYLHTTWPPRWKGANRNGARSLRVYKMTDFTDSLHVYLEFAARLLPNNLQRELNLT
jgi:hypothetical protein